MFLCCHKTKKPAKQRANNLQYLVVYIVRLFIDLIQKNATTNSYVKYLISYLLKRR